MKRLLPVQSSLRARLILLFGLLVTIPLTVAGVLLSLTGRDSVLSSGEELSRVGEETFRQSTAQLERLATRGTENASRQLIEIGQNHLTQLGKEQARLSGQGLREFSQRLSETAAGTLQDATEQMASTSDAVIADANSELRRLQTRAVQEASAALIQETRRAFEETGRQLVAANQESIIRLVQDLNLERTRRAAEQTYNRLARAEEVVREVAARPLARVPARALAAPAAGGSDLTHRVLERVVQNWNARLRHSLPVTLVSARLFALPDRWIPSPEAADPLEETRGFGERPEQTEKVETAPAGSPSLAPPHPLAQEVARSGQARFLISAPAGSAAPRATWIVPVTPAPELRAALVVEASLDFLTSEMSRSLMGENGRAPSFVASLADGQILAHSDPKRAGTAALPEEQIVLAAARQQAMGTMMGQMPGIGPVLCAFATVAPEDRAPKPEARSEASRTDSSDRMNRIDRMDGAVGPSNPSNPVDPVHPVEKSQPQAPSTELRASNLPWVVVSQQPLEAVLAKTATMKQTIHQAARRAADGMASETQRRVAALMAASVPEQRRIAAGAAAQIREGNRARITAAVAVLDRQQRQIAETAQQRIETRSRAAEAIARARMLDRAQLAVRHSTAALREQTGRSARTGLLQMQQLASHTANEAATRMLAHSLWLFAVFLLIALVSAVITARSLVRPIAAMAAATAAIARGEFNRRVPVQSRDELGSLALAFNDMAGAVQRGRSELEASNLILAREKSRIQAIVQSSPDGLAIADEAARVTFLNPAARHLLHVPPGSADTVTFAQMRRFLPHSAVQLLESWVREEQPEGPHDLILDAPHRILQVRCVPIAGEADGSSARLIHLHDVTREREIDEMKSNFVALVSHELRTPLTSILGFSSYMLTEKLGPITESQRTGLDSIHRQANRLKAIITDFLDLARIEAGKAVIRREPVALAGVARRVIEEMRPQAAEKQLSITLETPADAGRVLAVGDEARLAQILTNLLSNAVKFSEPGGQVAVEVAREGDRCAVRVRDTGMGIPEEELPRIFDRFYQVEKVATRKAGGTGLGLSIVKQIVEAMGGTITVESRVGEGTCFTVSLPAAANDRV